MQSIRAGRNATKSGEVYNQNLNNRIRLEIHLAIRTFLRVNVWTMTKGVKLCERGRSPSEHRESRSDER